ncbi:MAG: mechanosensitive ion channel domain-containing protein [Crocosphaera sp.]
MIKTRKWKRQLKSFIARFLIALLVFSSFSIFSSSSLVYGQDNSIDNDPINFLICPPSQRVNVNNQYLFCIWTKGNYDTESDRAKQINENFEVLKRQIIDKNLGIDFDLVVNNKPLANYNDKEILDYLDTKDINLQYYIDTEKNTENDTANKKIKFCLDECNGVAKNKLTKIVSIDKLIQEYDNKIQEYSKNNDDQGNIIKRIFDALTSATCYQNGMIEAAKLDNKIVFCFNDKKPLNIEQFNTDFKKLAEDRNTTIKSIKFIVSNQVSNQENISFLKQYITGSNEQNKEKVIKAIAEYRKKYCTAPVNLGDEKLFCILSGKNIKEKKERANKINDQLLLVAESNQIKTNDLIYQDNQNSFDIVRQQIQNNKLDLHRIQIMSVTNDDVIEDGRSLTIEELTKEYLEIISQAITSYRVKKDCPIIKYQVIFNNQPLFCIKTSLNEESPQQRVKKIQEQIDKINQAVLSLDSLSIVKVSDLNKIIGSFQYDSLINNKENINKKNPSIAIISQSEELISYKNQVIMIITNEDAKLIGDGKASTLTLANDYFLRIKEAIENYKPQEAWVTFDFGTFNGFLYWSYNRLFDRNKIQYGFEKERHKKLFFITELDEPNYYNLYYRALSISKDIKKVKILATSSLDKSIPRPYLMLMYSLSDKKILKSKLSQFKDKIDLTLTFSEIQFKDINLIQNEFVLDNYIKSIKNIIIDNIVMNLIITYRVFLFTVMLSYLMLFFLIVRMSFIYKKQGDENKGYELYVIAFLRDTINSITFESVLFYKVILSRFIYIYIKSISEVFFVLVYTFLFINIILSLIISLIDGFINILLSSIQLLVLSIWSFLKNDLPEVIPLFLIPTILIFVLLKGLQLLINKFLIKDNKKNNSKQNKIVNFLIIMISVLIGIMFISPKLPTLTGFSAFIIIVLTLTTPALIGDLISGFILILGNIVNEKDFIKAGDVVGKVEDQGLLVHKIRTTQNKIITISNIEILKNLVTNYSKTLIEDQTEKNNRLIIHISITLGYDVPWRRVEYMLIETAKNTNNILKNPEPFV